MNLRSLRAPQYLLTSVLIVLGALLSLSGTAEVSTADVYTESAHGSPTYGVNRSTATCANWPGGACVTGSCAHCHDTFDPDICGNDSNGFLLFALNDNPSSQTDNFCFECHKGSGSMQVGGMTNETYSTNAGGGTSTLSTIYEAFNPTTGSTPSSHDLADVLNHAVGRELGFTSNTNACLACHDHHASQKNFPVTPTGLGGVRTAIRRTADFGIPPIDLWGDEDAATSGRNERMLDYTNKYQSPYRVGGTTYEPAGDGTQDGSNLPNFKGFCTLQCHGRTDVYSTERGRNLRQIDWANEEHGNLHMGGQVGASIAPYTDPGFNYVLSCTDCHEPHGSENEWLLRTCVNGVDNLVVPGPGRHWYFCQACHNFNQHWAPWDDNLDCAQCHYHGHGGGMF